MPEIIGRWFTRQSVADSTSDATTIPSDSGGQLDIMTSSNGLKNTIKEVYCTCNGIDDRQTMVLCENKDFKKWYLVSF